MLLSMHAYLLVRCAICAGAIGLRLQFARLLFVVADGGHAMYNQSMTLRTCKEVAPGTAYRPLAHAYQYLRVP